MERALVSTNPVRPLWMPAGLRAPRRLGAEFSPPDAVNLVYLPSALLSCALLSWLTPTDFMLMVDSVLLSIVALFQLNKLILSDAPVRFSTFFVFALSFGYGLGTANTYFSLERGGLDLAVFLLKDPVVITHGMGAILFSLAVLLALGEWAEKPIFGNNFTLTIPPQANLLIVFGTLILMVGYKTGAIGFQGGILEEGARVGAFTTLVTWIISPLFGLTILGALNAPTKGNRRFLAAVCVLQFLLIVPTGRRNQLFAIMIGFFCVRLGKYRFRWSLTKKIVVAAALFVVLYAFTIAFFYLRVAGAKAAGSVPLSLGDRISAAIDYYQKTDYQEVQKEYSQNVQRRTFVLGFVSDLLDYSTRFTPGYGIDFYDQISEAMPSAFNADKVHGFSEESLVNQLFGTNYWDEANSVFTSGATDFGLLGMVLYPILFAALYRLAAEFFGQVLPTYVAVFLIVEMISTVLQPEQDISAYIVNLRNSVLFGALIWIAVALPWFRLRRPE